MIESIKLYRLNIPLIKPYKLSYGDVDYFDVVVAVVKKDGVYSCGNFTNLSGYFSIDIEEMWNKMAEIAPSLIGKDYIENNILLSPIAIALERFSFLKEESLKVPIIKIIDRSEEEISSSIPLSYKVKVGLPTGLKEDIKFVKKVSENIKSGSELRVDANSAYDFDKALEFVNAVGDKITYLEQPFEKVRFDWTKDLIEKTGVKIMLDESIESIEDIKKAKDCGVSYIKLKLAKFESISKMIEAMDFAESNGLKVIIGNGVDIDTSNYIEAIIWQKGKTRMAGEMNGFLKTAIKSSKLDFKDNAIYLNPDGKEFIFSDFPKEIIKKYFVYGE